MNNIPVIDMVFLIIIVLMVIHGYFRGFVEEIFSWASVALALLAAASFHSEGAKFVRTKIMENVEYVPEIIAFVAIFIIIMIFLKMVEQVLKDVVHSAKLGGLNKILGLVFGLVEGVAISILILFVLRVQPIFDVQQFIDESIFAQIVSPYIKLPLQGKEDIINTTILFTTDFPRMPV